MQDKFFSLDAATAVKNVTDAVIKLNRSSKPLYVQFLRWKVYTMPWKRNSRKRQMEKVCAMMERSRKQWEVF